MTGLSMDDKGFRGVGRQDLIHTNWVTREDSQLSRHTLTYTHTHTYL